MDTAHDASTLPVTHQTLKVAELFYSLQGEGRRAGEPSVFVRLSGCSAKYACYETGVRCDTEFESGRETPVSVLLTHVQSFHCPWVVWTGGEPLDQLTPEIVDAFRDAGLRQALETSGVRPLPATFDWVCISPKVAEHVLARNFPEVVNELRYVRHVGQGIPKPALRADHYFLSPHSDGQTINWENLQHCLRLCLENPSWALSVQMHKLLKIL